MKRFLWLCIRAELILLALALYWHHYIPQLVPYAKPQPSEDDHSLIFRDRGETHTDTFVWNTLNDRTVPEPPICLATTIRKGSLYRVFVHCGERP